MIITLDTDEIATLCKSGENVIMSEEAEKSLANLLAIQDQIGEFVEEVKAKIKENALAMDKNFTGFSGDYLKIELRKFGSKYAIECPEKLDPAYVKREIKESLDTKAIAEYEKANDGELPSGIERLIRTPQIVIRKKGR